MLASNLPEEKVLRKESALSLATDNLKYLGEWLLNEINEMKKRNDFTGLYSRSFDIGIYLGEFIIKNHEGAYWIQKRNIHDVDYGQVVIRNFLPFDLNIIGIAISTAQEIREDKFSENRFVELYNDWKNISECTPLSTEML